MSHEGDLVDGRLRTHTHPGRPPSYGVVMETKTPHWTELGNREILANRREHLVELKAQLPTTPHPIDKENLLMNIGQTEAVIEFCERYLELFPDSK